MSNYWNTLSPIHSLLTKRESHAKGGSVGGMGRPKYLGMAKGGRVNTSRENRLEELGRVDAEKSNKNRRAEKRRIVRELKK